MPVMNFDLEDGKPPVVFTLRPEDAKRFMDFMAECSANIKAGRAPAKPAQDLVAAIEGLDSERFYEESAYHQIYHDGFVDARTAAADLVAASLKGGE